MTKEELRLIQVFIGNLHDEWRVHARYNHPDFDRVKFILNREIKLKELDPRKETNK